MDRSYEGNAPNYSSFIIHHSSFSFTPNSELRTEGNSPFPLFTTQNLIQEEEDQALQRGGNNALHSSFIIHHSAFSFTPNFPDSNRIALQPRSRSLGETLFRFLTSLLLPEIIQDVYELRDYVTDLPRIDSSDRKAALLRVDSIYHRALYLTEGNLYETLLISGGATFPFKDFDAVLPLFEWVITIPVSLETQERYEQRLANIPSALFQDSRPVEDHDKLTHFFGSAWLRLVLASRGAAMTFGRSVEIFEKIFKLQGAYDDRDVVVNFLGCLFAEALLRGENALPSRYLDYNLSIPIHEQKHPDR